MENYINKSGKQNQTQLKKSQLIKHKMGNAMIIIKQSKKQQNNNINKKENIT